MFVISIVSAAVRSGKSFPFSAPATPARTGSASAAGPAWPGPRNASPDSILRHRLRKAFPALRRNTVQSYAIAPNKQSASAKFRTRNRVPSRRSRRSPAPPPLFAGGNSPPLRQPGKTELSRRPCRDSALALLRAAAQLIQPSGSRCPAHIPDISGPGARSRRPRNAPNTTRRGSPHSRRSRRRNRSRAGPANRTVPACGYSRGYIRPARPHSCRAAAGAWRGHAPDGPQFSALI